MKHLLPLAMLFLLSEIAFAQKSLLDEPGQAIFDGYIGDHYDIMMILKKTTGNKIEGRYIYKKQTAFISLSGEFKDNKLFLSEKDPKGKETGKFIFDFQFSVYPTMRGYWTKPNGTGKLEVYLKKVPFVVASYDFVKVKSTKVGNDTLVVASGLPAPVLSKVNALLHVSRNDEMQSMKNVVEYNMNGILTVFYNESATSGFSSSQFVCINTKEGRLLRYSDILQERFRSKMLEQYEVKVRESCENQLDKDYKPTLNDLNEPIVTRDGIQFISPCSRSIGYYLGPYTVEFEFEKIGEYLRK